MGGQGQQGTELKPNWRDLLRPPEPAAALVDATPSDWEPNGMCGLALVVAWSWPGNLVWLG